MCFFKCLIRWQYLSSLIQTWKVSRAGTGEDLGEISRENMKAVGNVWIFKKKCKELSWKNYFYIVANKLYQKVYEVIIETLFFIKFTIDEILIVGKKLNNS